MKKEQKKVVKKNKTVGQPTKYKSEYCQKIIDYFDRPAQVFKNKTEYYQNGNIKSQSEYPVATELPTFQRFARTIEINRDTLYEWQKAYPEFKEACEVAQQLQEHIWLVNGMSNLYNAQFAQFFGKNCLGYKDKIDVNNNNLNAEVPYEKLIEEMNK